MKVERSIMPGCCGKKQIIFKLDRPIQRPFIDFLVSNGFIEQTQYTAVGMAYVNNSVFILTAPIGTDRVNVKCKQGDCNDQLLNDLEELLIKME
jgi:hypothetical protein